MEDFIKVIKKDPNVQNKINIMLDRYMSLPYDFRSKIGCNSLIQNFIHKEFIDIMDNMITDLEVELKMEIYEQNNNSNICKYFININD